MGIPERVKKIQSKDTVCVFVNEQDWQGVFNNNDDIYVYINRARLVKHHQLATKNVTKPAVFRYSIPNLVHQTPLCEGMLASS